MDQPPADCLLERGMKNGMGVLDGSRREAARVHRVNNALDVERREAQESALTKRGANVTGRAKIGSHEKDLFRSFGRAASSSQRSRYWFRVKSSPASSLPWSRSSSRARIQVMLCRRKEPRRVRFE